MKQIGRGLQRYPYFDIGWGLRGQMILRTMLAVAYLLVGPPMPDRSR